MRIDELRHAVADMRWSTSPHPRATVFADGRYCVEDEPGCYSPVPVVADAVRRVLCGAGLGALRDAPVLRSWIGFTTHAAGGVADWDAALKHLSDAVVSSIDVSGATCQATTSSDERDVARSPSDHQGDVEAAAATPLPSGAP